MEDEDRRILNYPTSCIISPGGYIAIAEENGGVIGTGGLMVPASENEPSETLEIVKMATAPNAQGKGVGQALLNHLIEVARARGAKYLWLETNDKLAAATRLYARTGFRALQPDELRATPYSRCNLQMILAL